MICSCLIVLSSSFAQKLQFLPLIFGVFFVSFTAYSAFYLLLCIVLFDFSLGMFNFSLFSPLFLPFSCHFSLLYCCLVNVGAYLRLSYEMFPCSPLIFSALNNSLYTGTMIFNW
uniref:Uncharacterized protein n=1 Tax=Cacopsylla melanoneura TaxID=428564 RepID=A0A8D9DPH5_9HEMI